MYSKGDKVMLKNHPNKPTGIVIDVATYSPWSGTPNNYLVKYDADDLIPPQDWHSGEELAPCLPIGIQLNLMSPEVCECGSEKVGSSRHSYYCPKYRVDGL